MSETMPSLSPFVFDPDKEPLQEQAIFEGLLSKSDHAIWVGREKHRKTNVVLQFAICAAIGRDFLNFRFVAPKPLKIVYVDYESKSHKLWERYKAICRAMNLSEAENELLKNNLKIIEVRRMQKEGMIFIRFQVRVKKEFQENYNAFWQSFIEDFPADLYIFDPMRCMHSQDENDSNIEALLTKLRQFFGEASIIVPHHMSKRGNKPDAISLKDGMRQWSDGARGSGAIKAHSDVIICQERVIENETEIIYFGAFMKDEADIDPIPLEESDAMSFYWQVSPEMPDHLRGSYDALKKAGGKFGSKKAAINILEKAGVNIKTGYKHLSELKSLGFLKTKDGEMVLQILDASQIRVS